MADYLLTADGDGTTTGWTREPASGTFASKLEAVGSSDSGTSYVQSPNLANGQMFVTLSAVPGDFNPDDVTSIVLRAIALKVNTPSQGVDVSDLYLQVFRSDESTALTDESAVCNVTSTSVWTQFDRTVALNGTHSVDDWNGARLRLRFVHTQNQMADTVNQVQVTAAQVDGTYNVAATGRTGDGTTTLSVLSAASGVAATTGAGTATMALASAGAGGALVEADGTATVGLTGTGAGVVAAAGAGTATIGLASTGTGTE